MTPEQITQHIKKVLPHFHLGMSAQGLQIDAMVTTREQLELLCASLLATASLPSELDEITTTKAITEQLLAAKEVR